MVPSWVVWTIVGIISAIVLALLIVYIVKIVKMPVEQRKETLINFLIGLVTAAEEAYVEQGMGKEKIKDVEEAFYKTAPWFLKILLSLTKTTDLNELIELALKKSKETWGKSEE